MVGYNLVSIHLYRLKTGFNPPEDAPFMELRVGQDRNVVSLANQSKSRSAMSVIHVDTPYQRKMDLESKIKIQEAIVAKGQKEVAALGKMIETFTKTPQFGSAQQFQGQLETATQEVSKGEAALLAHRTDLADVEQLMGAGPRMAPSPNPSQVSGGSGIQPSPLPQREFSEDWGTEDSLPSPPVNELPDWTPGIPDISEDSHGMVEARTDFKGNEADSILTIVAGQQFLIIEPDAGGWTWVQDKQTGQEGFVPSDYMDFI
jgi:hypothetical protein